MLTSDHGEDLTEHDVYFNHGIFAYEACARVPLIISFPPKFAPKVIGNVVETIDIFSTILDFLGIEQINSLQGESLLPVLRGGDSENKSFKKFGFVEGNYNKRIITAIRAKDWKLLYKPYLLRGNGDALDLASFYSPIFIWRSLSYLCAFGMDVLSNYNMMYELYNVQEDPHEQKNLFLKRPAIGIPLREKLMKRMSAHPRLFVEDLIGKAEDKTLEKETRENLKTLGYIQ